MAANDRLGVGLPAVALVAGVLSGALLRSPVPESKRTSSGSVNADKATPAATIANTSWLADVRPVMELLAETLHVSVARDDVLRAARALQSNVSSRDTRVREALIALQKVRETRTPAQPNLPLSQEGALLDSYLRSDLDPQDRLHTLQAKIADAALDEVADNSAFARLIKHAADQQIDVKFLIATIPDYVDSNSAWKADQIVGAIQSALGQSGFVLDRFRLIDWSRADSRPDAAVANESRLHEKQPSALIFRQIGGDSGRVKITLQVVLLVLETPTGGIHRPAMLNALKFINRWGEDTAPDRRAQDIKIIGPTFSGSTLSLAKVLQTSGIEESRFHIISGSATADDNACVVERIVPGASYHTTVQTTERELALLETTLESINPQWTQGADTALLVEANTAYGQGAVQSDEQSDRGHRRGSTFCQAIERSRVRPFHKAHLFRFPLHIAGLRSDTPATATPALSLVPTSAIPLSLRETTPPADQIPEFRPALNSPVVESQVNSILDAIRHERLTLVGIVATDERDVLFLAKAVKREVPDAQLFFVSSSMIYLHSDYVPYMRGALVASTYPLYVPGQRTLDETGQEQSPRRREAFQSMSAEGVFNATLLQLDKNRQLADYCASGGQDRGACTPPVWVSVLGDDGFWPLSHQYFHQFAAASTSTFDPFPLHAGAGESISPLPPPLPALTIVLLALVLVVVAVHAAIAIQLRTTSIDLARSGYWSLTRLLAHPSETINASVAAAHRKARTFCALLLACVASWPLTLLCLQFGIFDGSSAAIGLGVILTMGVASLMSVVVSPATTLEHITAEGQSRRNMEQTAPGRWNMLLVTCLMGLFLATLLLFVWFEWTLLRQDEQGARAYQIARIVGGGIVSPSASILCLFGAMYVAMFTGLRRLALVGRGFVQLAHDSSAFRELSCSAPRRDKDGSRIGQQDQLALLLDLPVQHLPLQYVGGLFVTFVVCIVALAPSSWLGFSRPAPLVTTIDGYWFSWFLICATAVGLASAMLLVAQGVASWRRLRAGLERLAHLCIAPAFGSISDHARWDLSLTPPRVKELAPLIKLANRLHHGPRSPSGFEATDPHDLKEEADLEGSLLHSAIWFELWKSSDLALNVLEQRHWSAPDASTFLIPELGHDELKPASTRGWSHTAAAVVALQYAFVLRDILARIMSSLLAAMLCLTLVTCAHLFYVFQGRSSLLTIDLFAVVVASVAAVWVLVGFERDVVLSRLRHTTPGSIDFNWAFVQRVGIYGVLPLIAVVGALFPEVAGSVLGWLDPLKKLVAF